MSFKWYVFEGIDYSGKTTLARRITQELIKKYPKKTILFTAEPCLDVEKEPFPENVLRLNTLKRMALRKEIKENKNLSPEALLRLFLIDRECLLRNLKLFINLMGEDVIVVQDRSFISTLAYQSIYINKSINELMELNIELFKKLDFKYFPNIFFWLETSPKVALQRKQKIGVSDELDKKALNHLEQLAKNYEDIFLKYIHVYDDEIKHSIIVNINTDKKSIDELEKTAIKYL